MAVTKKSLTEKEPASKTLPIKSPKLTANPVAPSKMTTTRQGGRQQ